MFTDVEFLLLWSKKLLLKIATRSSSVPGLFDFLRCHTPLVGFAKQWCASPTGICCRSASALALHVHSQLQLSRQVEQGQQNLYSVCCLKFLPYASMRNQCPGQPSHDGQALRAVLHKEFHNLHIHNSVASHLHFLLLANVTHLLASTTIQRAQTSNYHSRNRQDTKLRFSAHYNIASQVGTRLT